MKIFAATSLALNFLLAVIASIFWLQHQKASPVTVTVANKEISLSAPVEKYTAPAPAPLFRWSQLESEDYPTFIANLRRIGCPEETIRLLVSGEISQIYLEKQQKFEASHQRPMQPSELHQFRQEQATVLAQTFPTSLTTDASSKPASSRIAGSEASRSRTPQSPPVYPLVFALARPPGATSAANATLSLSGGAGSAPPPENVTAAFNQIRNDFVNKIGGANQNPSDPTYYQKWTEAQMDADNLMLSLLGAEYYNHYTIEVAQKAFEAQPPQR